MPYASDRQRRFVHARANEGEPWAVKFAAHSDALMRKAKKKKGRLHKISKGLSVKDLAGATAAGFVASAAANQLPQNRSNWKSKRKKAVHKSFWDLAHPEEVAKVGGGVGGVKNVPVRVGKKPPTTGKPGVLNKVPKPTSVPKPPKATGKPVGIKVNPIKPQAIGSMGRAREAGYKAGTALRGLATPKQVGVGGLAAGALATPFLLYRHHQQQQQQPRMTMSKSYWGVEHGVEIAKAKKKKSEDMSVYRQGHWTTATEQKKINRYRAKNLGAGAGAVGLGVLATRTRSKLLGAGAGLAAGELGFGAGARTQRLESTGLLDKPYKRYKRAGGTDVAL